MKSASTMENVRSSFGLTMPRLVAQWNSSTVLNKGYVYEVKTRFPLVPWVPYCASCHGLKQRTDERSSHGAMPMVQGGGNWDCDSWTVDPSLRKSSFGRTNTVPAPAKVKDVVTVTRDGAVNLTSATTPPQPKQECTIHFPDNLRGRGVRITSGETTQVRWIPFGGGVQSSSLSVVHARVPNGSLKVCQQEPTRSPVVHAAVR